MNMKKLRLAVLLLPAVINDAQRQEYTSYVASEGGLYSYGPSTVSETLWGQSRGGLWYYRPWALHAGAAGTAVGGNSPGWFGE